MWAIMWCDLWKPVTCRKWWNCKIKEINIIILIFFFIFYDLWTSVTFDTSIRGDPSKKLWKENNSNLHMISTTQNINFAPCDGFSQITSHLSTSENRACAIHWLLLHFGIWDLNHYPQIIHVHFSEVSIQNICVSSNWWCYWPMIVTFVFLSYRYS